MLILALVVAQKVASQLLSSVVPGALVEQGAGDFVQRVLEPAQDAANVAVTVALSVTCSALVRWTPSRGAGLVAVAALALVMTLLVLQPVQLSYSALVVLMCVAGAAHWIIAQIALAISVARQAGLARYRLLGTVGAQALSLAVLLWPALAARGGLLVLTALVCGALTLALVLHARHAHSTSSADASPRDVTQQLVAPGAALLFLAVALVGLNGEQVVDARLKLSLRAAHALGVRGPMIVSHAMTIAARIAAYVNTGQAQMSPLAMILLWQGAQALRVTLLAVADVRTLPLALTATMIALDKWSGSLGEVALEIALLRFLSRHAAPRTASLAVTAVFLMGLMGPCESVTGSLAKLVARTEWLGGPAVLLLTVVPVAAVWRWTRESRREKKA